MSAPIRISVVGNSGSGKSTVAKALGKELGLPVYHLDRHLTTGNFEKLPREEYDAVHNGLISQGEWIIEGNYNRILADRVGRSTLVVFLNVGRPVTFFRVLRRVRGGGHQRDTIPDAAKADSVDWAFVKWTLGYSRRERLRFLRAECAKAGVPLLAVSGTVRDIVTKVREAVARQ